MWQKILGRKNLWYFLAVVTLDLCLYIYTLVPGLYWLDSAIYLVSVKELGVSYSPGYPLYLLLAKLWSFLPLFGFGFVQKVNLLSGVFAALASGFVYLTCIKLLENKFSFFKEKVETKWTITGFHRLLAALTAIIFGFSHSLWYQATYAEVYSMHTFLISVVIYLIVLLAAEGAPQKKLTDRQKKLILAIAAVYGLTYANHPVTVGFIPAIIWLVWQFRELLKKEPKFAKTALAVFFFCGLIFYLYLPIRSLQNPSMDWGNPENLGNFINHVSGPAGGSEERGYAFLNREFFENIFSWMKLTYYQFFSFGLLFIVYGLYSVWQHNKKMFRFVIIALTATVFFGVFYITGEYESWFLPAHYIFSIMLFVGAFHIAKARESLKFLILIILFFSIFSSLKFGWITLNRRGDFFPQEVGRHVLQNMEDKSVIFVESGAVLSSLVYNQSVIGEKPGVRIYHSSNFWLPWVQENMRDRAAGTDFYVPTSTADLALLPTPQDKLKYNNEFVLDLVKNNIDKYSFYTILPFELPGFKLIPWGYGYRIVSEKDETVAASADLWNFEFGNSKFCKIDWSDLFHFYSCREFGMNIDDGAGYFHPEDVQVHANKNFDEVRAGYAASYMNLGDLHISRSEYEEALPAYNRAINLINDNFKFEQKFGMYFKKALALFYNKQYEQAVEYAYKIDEMYPKKSEIAWILGSSFNKLGKNSEAFNILTEALRLFPKDENLNNAFNKILEDNNKSFAESDKQKE